MADKDMLMALNAIALIIGIVMLLGGLLSMIGIVINLFIPSNIWVGLAIVLLTGSKIIELQ